jgi:hypothetical protein
MHRHVEQVALGVGVLRPEDLLARSNARGSGPRQGRESDKDTLVLQPREESGKFGKAVTLHLTGTSQIATLSSRMMAKKLVMVQKDYLFWLIRGAGPPPG